MSGALIAAPLRIEEVLIRSADRTLRVRRTGMGPGRAQAAASELGRDPAGALLVVGFCGGLDESSVPGEVIVADTVLAATDEDHGHEQVDCTGVDRLIAAVERTGLGCAGVRSYASRASRWGRGAPSCTRLGRSPWTWSPSGWPGAPRAGRSPS